MADNKSESTATEEARRSRPVVWLVAGLGTAGVLLNINQVFNLRFFVDYQTLDTSYYYALIGLFLTVVFLTCPAHRRFAGMGPRWFDWCLAIATVAVLGYCSWNGRLVAQEGWNIVPPKEAVVVAALCCLLSLEAVRRTGGGILFFICLLFGSFPLYAEHLPGFLWGPSSTLEELVAAHVFDTESLIGTPVRVVAGTLVGFLLFGCALVATGGGGFFMDLSTALMGRNRGGAAKVAILSSGFFGSLSGSVISNIVTTGQITIPTMKRIGYPATYAGAIEACASTGGTLMPPVMGAVAFIMAEYLNITYAEVALAALVPALLFYIALILQVDNYAARMALGGQGEEEIPSLKEALKSGWHFLMALALLVYLLVATGLEARAPFYATLALIVMNTVLRGTAGLLAQAIETLRGTIQAVANLIGLLCGIGLIVGALSFTGVGGAFSRELLALADGNTALLLIFGAITSFFLGMGMTVSACYIFLAVVLGPALINAGLDPVASHLFILYWGMLSYITPPVALAAVTASSISGASALRTGVLSMRLGLINFILPFVFVLTPTLILHGDWLSIAHDVGTAVLAIWLMAVAFEGWLYGRGAIGVPSRVLALAAAAGLLVPGTYSDLVGLGLLAGAYLIPTLRGRSLSLNGSGPGR
ncbi:MAG: TRAP transporter fused permease subunit [Rhodospirillum sp.]|nr:TRAP transporter fused permease subunit [Rhodospirillum sp.]MCF8490558.1 TRAP transporter fused permease subunit [Rhodospirillum sp.]MCF8500604.1 TRAP transporter fused permease subunit [Rhodospirillum sp.]